MDEAKIVSMYQSYLENRIAILESKSLTISDVPIFRALYTLPQVPSPSSSKILYLEVKHTRKY